MNNHILYQEESYKIIGACFDVYKNMGPGFLESVYQECLEEVFKEQNIPYTSKTKLTLNFKNKELNQFYEADFICYDSIIIEIKSVKKLDDAHRAQTINYLKSTGLKLGLLVNFATFLNLSMKGF